MTRSRIGPTVLAVSHSGERGFIPRRLVVLVVLLVALAYAPGAIGASNDLFFSEYVEGSSNNKALEIFNDTGAPVDLGANAYNVQMFFNGATTPVTTVNLSGTVADDDVFVLAQALATFAAQADQTSSASWFNGDDAVVLRKGTTVIDVIGQVGFDPGTEWGTGLTSTADNTLRRKAAITDGDTTGSDAFDPAVQWDGFATDTFDGLGSHTAGPPPADPAPSVASTTPANGAANVAPGTDVTIAFSEAVSVSAATFAISCSASGVHPFALSGSGSTYTLNPDIDLADGETCTVTVDAAGVTDADTVDPPDTMAADYRFSFTTPGIIARIFQIQGAGHLSPLDDRLVSGVPGLVTAVRPNSFTMQDVDGDGSIATSDAILVFRTGIGSTVTVGQAVLVAGRVDEFRRAAPGARTT